MTRIMRRKRPIRDDLGMNDSWSRPEMVAGFASSQPNETLMAYARHVWQDGGGNVAFLDGHVKFYTPGALAAGTNWRKGISENAVVINDETQYLWDRK